MQWILHHLKQKALHSLNSSSLGIRVLCCDACVFLLILENHTEDYQRYEWFSLLILVTKQAG